MNKYAILIQKLVRFAFRMKETTIDPSGRYTVRALTKGKDGKMYQFGVFDIDHDFINFLDSRQYDTRVGGAEKIQDYLHQMSFQPPMDPQNQENFKIIDENYKRIQSGDEEYMKDMLKNKKNETAIRLEFVKKEKGVPMHDAALENFNRWKKGQVKIVSPATQI